MLAAVLFASCSNEEDGLSSFAEQPLQKVENYKVTPEEAETTLENFIVSNGYNGNARLSRAATTKHVAGITAIRQHNVISNNVATRAFGINSENNNVNIDTLMYAINFSDNQGFALVAADKRTEPILAIVDEGNFDVDSLDEDSDEGLLSFVSYAVNMEISDIEQYSSTQSSTTKKDNYTITSKTTPILHTNWSQTAPYGTYCPNSIAGCVVIATAQILSHYQTVGSVSWSYNGASGSATLHWSDIISECDQNFGQLKSNSTSANEVAHLVRYLGNAMGADYKSKSTSIGESKAIDWFNKWGGLNASSLKTYNESAIINAIKSGYPVYGRGNSGKKKVLGIRVGWKGGHAWVYDGVMTASKNGKSYNFIHCNWGWGGRNNGYYLSRTFDTNAGATDWDSSTGEYQSNGTSNYKYNLQYSIIKK